MGKVKLMVKPGTQNGAQVKLKGKGFPKYKKEGHFGDLFISFIKRMYDTKNTSNVLPGHGGVLDRLDSYLPTLPLFYPRIFSYFTTSILYSIPILYLCDGECIIEVAECVELPFLPLHGHKELLDAFECQLVTLYQDSEEYVITTSTDTTIFRFIEKGLNINCQVNQPQLKNTF